MTSRWDNWIFWILVISGSLKETTSICSLDLVRSDSISGSRGGCWGTFPWVQTLCINAFTERIDPEIYVLHLLLQFLTHGDFSWEGCLDHAWINDYNIWSYHLLYDGMDGIEYVQSCLHDFSLCSRWSTPMWFRIFTTGFFSLSDNVQMPHWINSGLVGSILNLFAWDISLTCFREYALLYSYLPNLRTLE